MARTFALSYAECFHEAEVYEHEAVSGECDVCMAVTDTTCVDCGYWVCEFCALPRVAAVPAPVPRWYPALGKAINYDQLCNLMQSMGQDDEHAWKAEWMVLRDATDVLPTWQLELEGWVISTPDVSVTSSDPPPLPLLPFVPPFPDSLPQ